MYIYIPFHSVSFSVYIYIYIYIHLCACIRACASVCLSGCLSGEFLHVWNRCKYMQTSCLPSKASTQSGVMLVKLRK